MWVCQRFASRYIQIDIQYIYQKLKLYNGAGKMWSPVDYICNTEWYKQNVLRSYKQKVLEEKEWVAFCSGKLGYLFEDEKDKDDWDRLSHKAWKLACARTRENSEK